MKKILIGLFFLNMSCGNAHTLAEPYKSIKTLPFDEKESYITEDALYASIEEKKPHIVIEIGSGLGSCTKYIAKNLNEKAKIYAIDSWLGFTTPADMQQFGGKPYLIPRFYQQFLSNMKHAQLTEKVIPIRMYSLEAATSLKIQADLIYINPCHEEHFVFDDIIAWNKHLNVDGILCGTGWNV